MIFEETKLKNSYIISVEELQDERGFFARCWDKDTFKEKGLNFDIIQCNISFNKKKGTLRGMHFQKDPCEESKLVRCTEGKIFDVIIDLRKNSKTYKQWVGIELSAENRKMLYVPKGFAHGYETLEDNVEVFYQVSEYYKPEFEGGVRWNDPKFEISWPLRPSVISSKDSSWYNFEE